MDLDHSIYLADDGTLDTVFFCHCGMDLRYCADYFFRADDGALVDLEAVLGEVLEDHLEDLAIGS